MEQLLQRYIRGEVSEEERLKVASWLDESPENMREFLALRKLYDISLWQTDMDKRLSVKSHFSQYKRIVVEVVKIAAILLIGFWGSKQLLTLRSGKSQKHTIHVPAGQRVETTLADGTHVWLNSRSTLKFPEQFSTNSRNVELDGEAYFSVQHNEKSPFIVQTPKYAIQVLGTEFNVKAYHDSPLFETALIKGSVEISSPELSQNVRLKPDEIAIANNGRLETSHIQNYNYFKWKEGLFCFENESIQSLIDKLQLYYDVRIDVQCPALLQYRYSGKFRIKDGIDHVLKVLQLKHKFTYTKNEEKNLIIIK
ncbi:FecR family protein [uncultured Parabacteroides sp.]|uniref:FecR family protein n=1 Tax=uncultured Parabacteroides sp. TaxID=512312 RepID=UPI00260F2197|nr:FecR family protein [uncultured Parabacteroides sp.]